LELAPAGADARARYKKIVMDEEAIDDLLVDLFLQAHRTKPPEPIVLDLDATDDPVHGNQEGRFFHGYFGNYCYLPLYIFSGEFLLCARLRPSNIDASYGAKEELERIVRRIRATWPTVPIVIRGDSGFCRDEIMTWCEENGVDYVLGLAKNARLVRAIGGELHRVQAVFEQTGQASRIFSEFFYRTKKSWSASRRVVAKAEHLSKGSNPRFVVTSPFPARRWKAGPCTKTSTAPAARWRTGSRSSSWPCLRTGPRQPTCGRISCGCTCRRSPTV